MALLHLPTAAIIIIQTIPAIRHSLPTTIALMTIVQKLELICTGMMDAIIMAIMPMMVMPIVQLPAMVMATAAAADATTGKERLKIVKKFPAFFRQGIFLSCFILFVQLLEPQTGLKQLTVPR